MSERTAIDILLEIENKVDNIVKLMHTIDMNNKILSNKLNSLSDKIGHNADAPKFSVEVSDNDMLKTSTVTQQIALSNKKVDRVSPLVKAQEKPVVAKQEPLSEKEEFPEFVPEQKINITPNTSPVIQRVLDGKNNKLYMAEVKIFDKEGNVLIKTTTNSAGKWNASLPEGNWKVLVSKSASVNRPKLEEIQIITVKANNKINDLGDFVLTQAAGEK